MDGFSFGRWSASVDQALARIEQKLDAVLLMEVEQMADLSRVTQEVTENSDAVDSAVVLLGQLAQLVRDNATDQAALNDIADQLDAKGQALAEAVVANTPADPSAPPPEPAPS